MIKQLVCFALSFVLSSSLLAERQPLKVAAAYFIPPYVIQSGSDHIYGFDIDLMLYICQKLNRPCEFSHMNFQDILPSIMRGQFDVGISAITIIPSRSRQVNFSIPYLPSYARFLTNQDTFKQHGQKFHLAHLKAGVVRGTVFNKILEAQGVPAQQIISFDSEAELIEAMSQNKVDIILEDQPTVNYWAIKDESFALYGKPIAYGYGMGVAISPQAPELTKKINAALKQFLAGPLFTKEYHIYFGSRELS